MKSTIARFMIMTGLLIILQAINVHGMAFNRPTIASFGTVVDDGTWSGNAIVERWGALGSTNVVIFPTNNSQKGFLTSIKSHLVSLYPHYVDQSHAIVGTFNHYFKANTTDWVWRRVINITTNSEDICTTNYYTITTSLYWEATGYLTQFPLWTRDAFIEHVGLPYDPGPVRSYQITATVPGWFVGQTNVHTLTNYTFNAVSTGQHVRTWFDHTPYRDLGGWGQGLSWSNSGIWRFRSSFIIPSSPGTNRAVVHDAVGGAYIREVIATGPTNGGVTGVVFSLFRHAEVLTIATPQATNMIFVTSPAGLPGPALPFTVINPATEAIVTNFTSSLYPSGATTTMVYSAAYGVSNFVIMHEWSAIYHAIATNTTESDYGYKYMRQVLSNLTWTAHSDYMSSTSAAYRGFWTGCAANDTQVDNADWTHSTTSHFPIFPGAGKISFFQSGDPNPPTLPDACGDETPEEDGDCTYSVSYTLVGVGCWRVGNALPFGVSAESCGQGFGWALNEWFPSYYEYNAWNYSAPFYVSEPTYYWILYKECCPVSTIEGSTNKNPLSVYVAVRVIVPASCYDDGGLVHDCRPGILGDNTYTYDYSRNSQVIQFFNYPPGLAATRAIYLIGTNPIDNKRQPDNEAGWQGELLNTYSQYVTTQETGIYSLNDFHKNTKPFGSDALEKKGWSITGALELRKWDFGYR